MSTPSSFFPCQFLTSPISKNPKLLDSGTTLEFKEIRKHLLQREGSFSAVLLQGPPAQAYSHLASTCTLLPLIPLYYSNNASLVPGKPTWCTKMLSLTPNGFFP